MLAGEDVLPLQACTEHSWRKWGGQFHSPLPERLQSTSKAHIVLHEQKMKTCHVPIKCIAASIPSKCGNDNCNLHANHLHWAPGPNRAGHKDPRSDLWSPQASVATGSTLLFRAGRKGEGKERGLLRALQPIKSCRCEDRRELPKKQAAQGQTVSNQ